MNPPSTMNSSPTINPPLPYQADTITQFWDLDRLGITEDPDPSVDKDEDARILKRFQDTAQIIDGYLHVQFPWKTSHPRLADNKMLALKRLQSQFRSFQSKQHLWKEYANTISDYHNKGIIEEVDEHQFDDHRVYYIPHQAVIKESSATTKLRVVFDASSHYKGAPSLNDCLHSGPAILPDLNIWQKGYLWDEPFREEDHHQWQELVRNLKHPLPPIPRFIASNDEAATYELAVFGDASKRLFACCAYLICRTPTSTTSRLVMAKSLLAPTKQQVTMPRLELLASLISVRLARFLHSQLNLNITTIHLFSDSLIALHWLHSTRPLKRFVQNRVDPIRTILATFTSADIQTKFYYVQSEVNPADCATRGLSTKEAKNHIWWQGPPFLQQPPSEWPKAGTDFALPPGTGSEAEYEFRAITVIPDKPYKSPIRFTATSSYLKLIRSTAYVLKFVKALFTRTGIPSKTLNLTTITPSKDISAREIITAETLLITEHYKECETTLKRLPLDHLNAHRSSDGLIRCPNRLDNTRTSHQSPTPILLLPEHRLVHLLVMYYHKTHYHAGVHSTIASLRSSYLIPSIKSTVTKILRLCTICKKAQGHAYRYPEMPSLPPERVNRSRPFQNVGLDYLGP
ncbi:hypothetical protein ANCDUO_17055, partial [Ancylostoma duodenale]